MVQSNAYGVSVTRIIITNITKYDINDTRICEGSHFTVKAE